MPREIFNSSGTFTPPDGVTEVDVLIVGGGGGGGRAGSSGAGGSGGQVRWETGVSVTPGVGVTVTVGAGGAGRSGSTGAGSGGSSSYFGALEAIGGGAGAGGGSSVPTAGAYGGGGHAASGDRSGATGLVAYSGGDGANWGSGMAGAAAGGGGGAGGAGADAYNDASTVKGGDGGPGLDMSAYVGADVGDGGWFGGGGGGGTQDNGVGTIDSGLGGAGGGGEGRIDSEVAAGQAGQANTGGGGGGGGGSNLAGGASDGGNGGSGVVIVMYGDVELPTAITETGFGKVDYPTGGTSSTFTVPLNSGDGQDVQADDVMIFSVTTATNNITTITPPTDAIELIPMQGNPHNVSISAGLYAWRVPTPKPSSVTFNWGTARRGSIAWVSFSNVHDDIIDAFAWSNTWFDEGSSSHDLPALSTVSDEAYVLGGLNQNSGSATISAATPGWTIRTNVTERDGCIAIKGIQDTAGSTGTNTFNVSNEQIYMTWQMALKPIDSDAEPPDPPVVVEAKVSTELFPGFSGDVADGAAIVVDEVDPSRSVVLVSNKGVGGGIYTLNLDGEIIDSNLDGGANSIDWRDVSGLSGWDDRLLILTSDRDDYGLQFYWMDRTTKELTSAGHHSLAWEPYGTCLYVHSNGTVYAFVTQRGSDDVSPRNMYQYPLSRSGDTVVAGSVARTVSLDSVVEGLAADDNTGYLYAGEENEGLYRYNASPSGGSSRTTIDLVDAGNLHDDVEDVAITNTPDGVKILVSSQGDDSYHVYDATTLEHELRFTVTRPGTSTQVTDTDGLDVYVGYLGPQFPRGIMVIHDGGNISPVSNLVFCDVDQVFSYDFPDPEVIEDSSSASLTDPANRWVKSPAYASWWDAANEEWRAILPTSSGHRLYTLDKEGGATQGAVVDNRQGARVSVLYHGSTTYVLRQHSSGSLLTTYDSSWSTVLEDVSVPLAPSNADASPVSFIRTGNGYLWAAAMYDGQIRITRSTDGGATWSSATTFALGTSGQTGMVQLLEAGTNVVFVAMGNDGIGRDVRRISRSAASISSGNWTSETLPALSTVTSDDHLSGVSMPDGRLVLFSKTTDATTSGHTLLYGLERATNGTWSQFTLEPGPDDDTFSRPRVVFDGTFLQIFYGHISDDNLYWRTAKADDPSDFSGRGDLLNTSSDWSDSAALPRSEDVVLANTDHWPLLANSRSDDQITIQWIPRGITDPVTATPKLYLGTVPVTKLYLGTTDITSVYVGESSVYDDN